ncbi:hypothetical protein [Aeromicrobium sp. NPDC092404]|uniref:hypothetical protein n=1 Tax=Aeromicrobium sp. NPDC092404 TaxID=3154976 RepID=UPI003427835F
MFSRTAARRTAAALTAALVAVLLVTVGGSTRTQTQRLTISGASHAGAAAKATRVPQAALPAHHLQDPLQLELVSTPPSEAPDVHPSVAVTTSETVVVRTGRDRVTPTGRAPPAL